MRVDVITIFPDYLSPLGLSLVGKARDRGLLDVRVHDLRRWTDDVHRTVDDSPYGGGAGMVMAPEPWGRALSELVESELTESELRGGEYDVTPRLVIPSPAGKPFTQALAAELAAEPWLLFACGRYEGIDARVAEHAATVMRVDEVSLGDYVLNGGEVAALAIIESVARLLPGVVGNPDSVVEESHSAGLLEQPAYTRPPRWRELDVPSVLLSGDHQAIERWRRDEALRRTALRRPDLAAGLDWAALDDRDRAVLAEAGFAGPPPPVAD